MNASGDENHQQHGSMPARAVVRVGGRVYRPVGWWTPAVHTLLRYLQESGFRYAPRTLGVDRQGREILTHIPGCSGRHGWAAIVADHGLASFARLLWAYHDAVRDFMPPTDAVWACTNASLQAGQLVCHGDFGSWNIVWQGGQPVGILDWDMAEPGPPMDDIDYALAYSIPFRDDQTALRWLGYEQPPDRRRRIEVFADAYGLASTAGLVERVARRQAGPGPGPHAGSAVAAAPEEPGRRRLPGGPGGTSSLDRAPPCAVRVTSTQASQPPTTIVSPTPKLDGIDGRPRSVSDIPDGQYQPRAGAISGEADHPMADGSEKLSEASRGVLQAIYGLLRQRGSWPTFRRVDLRLDRSLGIEDAQAALAAVPPRLLQRAWQQHGFYENDEVRLTLRGIAQCDGGPDDLELVTRLLRWMVTLEQSPDLAEEDDLAVTSAEFAEELGIRLEPEVSDQIPQELQGVAAVEQGPVVAGVDYEPAIRPIGPERSAAAVDSDTAADPGVEESRATLARLRVIADLLPSFWNSSTSDPERPWLWQYKVDRRRLRPYRALRDTSEVLEYVDSQQASATALSGGRLHLETEIVGEVFGGEAEESSPVGAEADVALTVLRPEIAEASGRQLRAGLYDDAIFAAYRRVEHQLQQRAKLPTTIGDPLVKQAFQEVIDPIRISTREKDTERLIQLFSGALGLLKGDRSHKDKPALPCRSMRECMRQLAQASALLDLLDRDVAVAPYVRGYDQHGEVLELWVERAGPQSEVWLGEHPCQVRSHKPGSLVLDVDGVPPGEHDLFIIDGSRQSPVTPIWLTGDMSRAPWYRVSEVNIPLFCDETGAQPLDVVGVRLLSLEGGVTQERIVPTAASYRVGDYVTWEWETSTARGTGPVWVREYRDGPLQQWWSDSILFRGEPVSPAHDPRLVKVTLEPTTLVLRRQERAPVRALGHYTDGTGTWTDPIDALDVTADDEKIACVRRGVLYANQHGRTTLRFQRDGLYASAIVDIAAHPRGTKTDVMTGLPPVTGLTWANDALIVSARSRELWRIGTDGKFSVAAAVPLQAPTYGGTDRLAAADNGDLAVRLVGHGDLLVLDANSDYQRSRWVSTPELSTVMAMTWDSADLILALANGEIWRVRPDATLELVISLPERPVVSIARDNEALLALTGPASPALWRIPLAQPDRAVDILADCKPVPANNVASIQGNVYVTDFHGGRLLRLDGTQLTVVAMGLRNPTEMATDPDGTIYIAELEPGAVRRLLP